MNRETWSIHRPWVIFVIVATMLLSLSYWAYVIAYGSAVSGSTWPGIIYGSLALGIMFFDALLGARKKVPSWRVGRASSWLRGHLWLSLLLFPLLFFHSAFQWGGTMTGVLWFLFIFVMGSGLLGIALQQILPRLMTEAVSMETIYQQIPHVLSQLLYDADVRVAQAVGALGFDLVAPEGVTGARLKEVVATEDTERFKKIYLQEIRPYLERQYSLRKKFASREQMLSRMRGLKTLMPVMFHDLMDVLVSYLEEKRELEIQRLLHFWLHSWLVVHVPLSVLLIVLSCIHAVVALWY